MRLLRDSARFVARDPASWFLLALAVFLAAIAVIATGCAALLPRQGDVAAVADATISHAPTPDAGPVPAAQLRVNSAFNSYRLAVKAKAEADGDMALQRLLEDQRIGEHRIFVPLAGEAAPHQQVPRLVRVYHLFADGGVQVVLGATGSYADGAWEWQWDALQRHTPPGLRQKGGAAY